MEGFQITDGTYKIFTKSSTAQSSLKKTNSTSWVFDFSDVLLFDGKWIGINFIDYSIQIESGSPNSFVQHSASMDSNNPLTVTINTDKPCDATVYIKVDQSTYVPSVPN